MSGRLQGKRALITGASRGIGAAVARRFAAEGAHLILVARTLKDLEILDDQVKSYGVECTLVTLDLKNLHAVTELARAVAERFQGLDILVGNAALLGTLGPVAHCESETWQNVQNVNFHANWHLIQGFDALLKKASAGRAIFVTCGSITHKVHPYWGPYAASKIALERVVKTYAAEVANTYPRLKINLIDPGIVRTTLRAEAIPGENPAPLPSPEDITEGFVELACEACCYHGEVYEAMPTLTRGMEQAIRRG